MPPSNHLLVTVLLLLLSIRVFSAEVVPNEVQMPGTQPGEVSNLESPTKCDNCHAGYDSAVEPVYTWQGGMMAHAARDPLYWATLAVAEQTFDGAGDLCLRCHNAGGWLAGRSTPTDGSGLSENSDAAGVECDLCHKLTNPDQSEHLGVQNSPFIANNQDMPVEGNYGSGQYVIWNESSKLGPYDVTDATHQFLQSQYHRSSDLCGTCHDVSNPVVGDLAPGNGAQVPLEPGTFSGVLGTSIETKAAFNNRPYEYGVVERTYSEHVASAFPSTLVSDYSSLPGDLQKGAIEKAYQAAQLAGNGGDYTDGTPRYFTCQTCHMPPVNGQGCNKNPAVRDDLPLHDLTGGSVWMPGVIQYMDEQNTLVFGGGLSDDENLALNSGVLRAMQTLESAAALEIEENTLKIINLTGHKLLSGYPEGRRMWLNIQWYDDQDSLIREDGAYGEIQTQVDGQAVTVETLLDLSGSNTRIYEVHGAITQPWAYKLVNELGAPASLPVEYDRETGNILYTLGELAAESEDAYHESFHFVLNNYVAKDNRIPPYGMQYDEARKRNALPVPETQFGDPGAGGVYEYWDKLVLNPPVEAVRADIKLMYQSTSWEYIQFLLLANNGSNDFLKDTGHNMYDAWLNTGMAPPYVMATESWVTTNIDTDGDGLLDSFEEFLGTNPAEIDTDGDGISDYDEVAYDGDPDTYTPGFDLNPLTDDTDGDYLPDQTDPLPLDYHHLDGDLAPYNAPDGVVNMADVLIAQRLLLGQNTVTDLQLVHADLYPPRAPDGQFTMSDLLLIRQIPGF